MSLIQHFQFNENDLYTLRVYGSVDAPLFVAREIASILGLESSYRNFVASLDADEKQSAVLPTNGGKQQMTLISESAVYKMIFKSRKPIAVKFQNWICREVIPTLRRQGSLQLQQQVEELNQLLVKQQRATQQLGTYMENMRFRQNNQFIYIATSQYYATQNSFKVGGCTSESLLRKRLATYNSGRASGDELYYVCLFQCHNHQHVEARIKELLIDFRMQKDKEMYVLPYETLRSFVERIVSHYQKEVDCLNDVLRNLLNAVTTTTPVVPPPLEMPSQAQDHAQKTDEVDALNLDTLSLEEQKEWTEKWIEQYRNAHPDIDVIERKSFEQFVEQQDVQFRKRTLWSHLKSIASTVQEFTAKYF